MRGLVMVVAVVMATQMGLELGKRRALFAALADLAPGHLRQTCRDMKYDEHPLT